MFYNELKAFPAKLVSIIDHYSLVVMRFTCVGDINYKTELRVVRFDITF